MKINEHHMNINENQWNKWKYMKINQNLGKSLKNYEKNSENQWKHWKFMKIIWQSMKINANRVKINENKLKSMKIHEDHRKSISANKI